MRARHGAVAAGHPRTAEAADQVLREGGNAYDATLAALATACVAEPVLASLGGGGFLLALPEGQAPRVYDFFVHTARHKKPAEDLEFDPIEVDFGATRQAFHIGRGTAAVPGLVRGLLEVHRDLCTMGVRDVVAPAVELAKNGVEVTAYQAYLLDVVRPSFAATDASLEIFGSPGRPGELVGEGERLILSALADTLETLAIEGDDLFYRGEIASRLARDMAQGGLIGLEDLAGYHVERRAPLELDYRDARICTNPPPSSGGLLVAFGLKLLEPVAVSRLAVGSSAHVSLLARVMELTLRARIDALARGEHDDLDESSLLDPVFMTRYRTELAGLAHASRGTTHISVIDAKGNLASASVSNGEGCGYLIPGTGIVMNNMLGEADLNPNGFHRWPTDRRMSSMMAPTAVLWRDGNRAVTGSGGSNRIRTAVLQLLVNLLDWRMPAEEAVQAPRLHFEDGLLSIEGGFEPERLGEVLEAYPEHQLWEALNMFFGGAHTVVAQSLDLTAVGDPRRGGVGLVS